MNSIKSLYLWNVLPKTTTSKYLLVISKHYIRSLIKVKKILQNG